MIQEFEDGELLSPTQTSKYLNVSRYHLIKLAEQPEFPKPLALTTKTMRWKKHELDEWLGKQS